jgi:hypothetical protein
MRKPTFSTVALAGSGLAATALLVGACQNYGSQKMAEGAPAVPDKISYNFDVRPVLSQNCFGCHGSGTQKAGLRLDDEKIAKGKLPENKSHRAIVAGNPGKSEIIKRITSTDPDFRMPPREAHKTLSPYEVALLTKWVKQGAKYEQHWAYIAPKEVRPERTPWDKQAVNRIDNYIYNGLTKAKLHPSPEADRETLINRVTLDLTGLPPTLEEVDAFLADKRPDAYERLVDRLLASTAYAERQAQSWMDVARYGDTDGYLDDIDGRFQYPYRDWVISAFARNIPYDKFVTWQLAGDKLPNPTREQILATAFTKSNAKNSEMGLIEEENRVAYVNERTELVGKAFLGLTVACAKCHDHKYDVISQADYYSLGGFFNSLDEKGRGAAGATLDWPTPMQAARRDKAKAVADAKEAAYRAVYAKVSQEMQGKAAALARSAQLQPSIQATLNEAQEAYYPFEDYYKASFEPLMVDPGERKNGGRYAALAALVPGGAKAGKNGGLVAVKPAAGKPGLAKTSAPAGAGPGRPKGPPGGAPGGMGPRGPGGPPPFDPGKKRVAQDDINLAVGTWIAQGKRLYVSDSSLRTKQLFVGLKEEQLFWMKSGVPGAKPGAMNNGHIVPGPAGKGKAVMVDNTIGFADENVGKFERTQPYSFDLWVKLRADKPYDDVNILFNGSAYAIGLSDNRLTWGVVSQAPANQINVQTKAQLPKGRWVHIAATYDGTSRASGLKLYADGKPMETMVLHDNLTGSAFPRGLHNQFGSYTGLSIGHAFGVPEFQKGAVDELRVFKRALTPTEVAYLHDAGAVRSAAPEAVQADIAAMLTAKDPRVAKAETEWKEAVLAHQASQQGIKTLAVLKDAMTVRPTYLLTRGNYDQHGKEVPVQALPRVFAWSEKYPRNRLGLTQWMFDPKNPLTSRVYVNRMWQSHFGTGIVETVDDFGTQGSNPTNLPLLDYLAIEFQRSGWDMKHMHKLMVMSATYRQSSNIPRDLLEKDSRNFLLARGPRYRLPAEMIRDNALMASGLLDRTIGGDAVFPYQPDGVWKGIGTGPNIYPTDVPADQMHRRTMYTYIKRNVLFPTLQVFDVQDRNTSSVTRKISNTPLQALVLLNDPQYMEAYRKLAERTIRMNPNDSDAQIVTAFRLATRRHPMAKEMAVLKKYRADEVQRLSATPEEVGKILAIGVAPADISLNRVQVAAMTMVTAAVMNTPDAYSLR